MIATLLVFCKYELSQPQKTDLIYALKETNWSSTPFAHGELCKALSYLMPRYAEVNGAKLIADKYQNKFGWRYLSDWMNESSRGSAKSVIRLLKKLAAPEKPTAETQSSFRLLYIVNTKRQVIEIKKQTLNTKGKWTPGKRLSIEKFGIESQEKKLSTHDTKVASVILGDYGKPARYSEYNYGVIMNEYYPTLPYKAALYHLSGHDNVVLDNKRSPLTITEVEPTFSVVDTSNGIQLTFSPAGAYEEYHCEQKTPTLFNVYKLTDSEIELSQKLTTPQLIPNDQRADLETTLPELRKSIRVSSLIDIDTDALDKVEGNTKPTAHLLPFEGGYDIQLVLQPIVDTPYFVTPGEGMLQDIVTLDPEADVPERVLLSRNLDLEQEAITHVITAAKCLELQQNKLFCWSFPTPAGALHLLRELYDAQMKDLVTIEYPKGQKLKLSRQISTSNKLVLQISQARDWFAVTGSLRIDENRVLDFSQLLAHTRGSESKYVKLGENDYFEISEELAARLTNLDALLHDRSGKASLPQLAANALEDLIGDLDDVELDDQWRAQLDRAEKAKRVRPRVPKDFDADLRDYQKEGFEWMMRLAAWGVGACLADDMGLGKTIQALAILTSRAKEGPALVLAPASVTRNWVRETEKFAPALTPVLVATSSDTHLIDEAGKGDLLIVSYGLISYIEDALTTKINKAKEETTRRFATLLLDEAQAIKNPAAKRTKLVYSLEADFKLALTGTPIENNLGELWSLFRYLNPGLLGSLQAFTSKYARPLSASTPQPVLAQQLRSLVQPFILRRRKDQVLKDLPAKTEIVLDVVPGDKERALYEAIRREAVDKLATATPEQQRFMVLQQLTRLRQAACHPKLVRPQSKLESAKLKLIGETIQELIANGHRALIFSQFVKHLKLVEAWVLAAGISYNYLDGSTPGKKREKLVDEFQNGEANLFLISLKAGGTGLNLTGADYVLHLDPWWNPAAEDQASDRAHRIGQKKPVTVYRFVTRGTIEESIISLHAEKRDLADQLLSGTDQSAKLSMSDMLELVKEG